MSTPVNLHEFEQLARERLPRMVFDYYAGGANDEVTLRENRAAFERLRLLPRMMVDVSACDLSTTLFGQPLALPLLVAPMAFMRMAHPDGELAVARAASLCGVGMTLSTMSTTPLEQVAAAQTAARWFQLYVYKDRAVTRALVQRAEAAGFQALVVTVDAPRLGRREADVRNGFHLPPGLTAANLMNAQLQTVGAADGDSGLAAYIASLWDAALTWNDLDWLRGITRLPVLVKGVLRPDDAVKAVEHGAAGIVVSNHGGRQLDGAPAAITMLPHVAAAVAGRALLLVDSGIRRGTDVLKALALGAQAVLLGRPVLWGLALDGEAGVRQVLTLLADELELALMLCGCASLADVSADLLLP